MIFLHYTLLLLLIILQCCVILFSQNTIHSLLILINIYLTTSVVYFVIGAEFLALILVIVYVGAISILFLFIIMMLNLRISELYNKLTIYAPIGYSIGLLFIVEILYILYNDMLFIETYHYIYQNNIFMYSNKNNILLVGEILYNHCYILL